ncbi:MAG TPA: acyl carrier protein [Kofleriaceae bacterium]
MTANQVLPLILDALHEVVPETAGVAAVPSDSMEDLGANSLDRADIVMMVLERMNLAIPLTETVGPRNLGELAQLLSDKST